MGLLLDWGQIMEVKDVPILSSTFKTASEIHERRHGQEDQMRSSMDHLWMDESDVEMALRLIRPNTRAEQ